MEELFAMLALLVSGVALGVSLGRPASAPRQETAAPPAVSPEDARRERELNEGVENILSYSVRLGRGKTTGGEGV